MTIELTVSSKSKYIDLWNCIIDTKLIIIWPKFIFTVGVLGSAYLFLK